MLCLIWLFAAVFAGFSGLFMIGVVGCLLVSVVGLTYDTLHTGVCALALGLLWCCGVWFCYVWL